MQLIFGKHRRKWRRVRAHLYDNVASGALQRVIHHKGAQGHAADEERQRKEDLHCMLPRHGKGSTDANLLRFIKCRWLHSNGYQRRSMMVSTRVRNPPSRHGSGNFGSYYNGCIPEDAGMLICRLLCGTPRQASVVCMAGMLKRRVERSGVQ